jgi:hypothetical protein
MMDEEEGYRMKGKRKSKGKGQKSKGKNIENRLEASG